MVELSKKESFLRDLFFIERQLIEINDDDLVNVQSIHERTSNLASQYFTLYTIIQDEQYLLSDFYDHTKVFVTSLQGISEWLSVATKTLDDIDVRSSESSVEKKLASIKVFEKFYYSHSPQKF